MKNAALLRNVIAMLNFPHTNLHRLNHEFKFTSALFGTEDEDGGHAPPLALGNSSQHPSCASMLTTFCFLYFSPSVVVVVNNRYPWIFAFFISSTLFILPLLIPNSVSIVIIYIHRYNSSVHTHTHIP